jgi:hypothetical protein
MTTPFSQASEQVFQRRIVDASIYSAHIQEAMRYNKLSSAHYALVMTLLDAVSKGHTEEKWKAEYQRTVQALIDQSPDKSVSYPDAANRYEQSVNCLKDLTLWPW